MRILLQARTGEDSGAASSTQGAAHVFGYPYTVMCHVLHLIVTACKCSEQAVSAEAEANMKNPSKAVLLQRERRLLLLVIYAGQNPFLSGRCPVTATCRVSAPWTRTERVDGEYRLLKLRAQFILSILPEVV